MLRSIQAVGFTYFSISFFTFAFSANHLVYFGGGGESLKNQTTVADNSGYAMTWFEKNGWETKFYFGGEQPLPKAQINAELKKPTKDFTKENFEKQIAQIERSLNSSEYKSGDQILITLDTHGVPSEGGVHNVLAINHELVDLDRLKSLIAAAEKKGVKVAILDLSCYGGSSLSLATPKTCVVSASRPNGIAYSTDAEALAIELFASENLEEAYLKARKSVTGGAQPEISTLAHAYAINKLEPLEKALMFENVLQRDFEQKKMSCGLSSPELQKVSKEVKHIERQTAFTFAGQEVLKIKQPYSQELTNKLERYKVLSQSLRSWYSAIAEKEICTGNLCVKAQLVDSYVSYYEDAFARAEKAGNRVTANEFKKALNSLKKIQTSPAEFPAYARWKMHMNNNSAARELNYLVLEISKDERALYDHFYSQKKNEIPNPCRDFKLPQDKSNKTAR